MPQKKTNAEKSVKKASTKKSIPKKKKAKLKTTQTTKRKSVSAKKNIVIPSASKKKQEKIAVEANNLGLWTRFIAVFTPTFLDRLGLQKSHGKSWGFWFLSNFFLAVIPFFIFLGFQSSFFDEFPQKFVDKIPDNMAFTLDDGQTYNIKDTIKDFELSLDAEGMLSAENLPDPFILISETGEDEDMKSFTNIESIDIDFAELAIIFDTKNMLDIDAITQNFNNYIYVLRDKTVIYDSSDRSVQTISYIDLIQNNDISEFPKTLDYNMLVSFTPFVREFTFIFAIVSTIVLYLFFAVIRLINALFWALVFWPVGVLSNIPDWSFEKSFMAMLHFSFVTLLFVPIGIMFGNIFLYTLVLLSLLFGMNFWSMKHK